MSVIWERPSLDEIKTAYDRLFHSSLTLSKIKDAALDGRLLPGQGSLIAGRSLAWKLFLLAPDVPLQSEPASLHPDPYVASCSNARHEYQRILLEKMSAPDGSYEDGLQVPGLGSSPPKRSTNATNLNTNNPLSLHVENPWKEWFAAMELKKTIAQDVERTFPEIAYFRDVEVQHHLTNVLYLWSSMNPEIGYRQGMHELLAMIYIAVDYDSVDEAPDRNGTMETLCARTWVVADAWALFVSLMYGMGKWYEWREPSSQANSSHLKSHVHLPLENGQVVAPSYVAPVVQSCNRMQSQYLRSVDPVLWRSMQAAGIEPQIFGIRWLRLLFTREFPISDAMVLWDGILACDLEFHIAEWVCVAMLVRIRNYLIPADYSEQLTCLLRYPALQNTELFDATTPHSSTLLLRQAIALQFAPNAATGSSIAIENRNLLHIPLEVPEPPPPPPRRQNRHQERAKSPSDSGSGGTVRASHLKQLSQQAQSMGFPDIAKGLFDKGESLGINKTSFFNAVSELRRNLPDLAASAASLVKSPNQQTSFPLVDERTIEERPPWEPKTRRELELEVETVKATQYRLGESVAWIVDVLLQSDDDDMKRTEKLMKRKREAIESLAHVRDVLQGHTPIEDDRLWDEEEMNRRHTKQATPALSMSSAINLAQPAAVASPLANTTSLTSTSTVPKVAQTKTAASSSVPPNQTPNLTRSSVLPPTSSPISSSFSPANNTPSISSAPWKYTKSDFHAPSPGLPPPKPTSSVLPRTPSPNIPKTAPAVRSSPMSPVISNPPRQSLDSSGKERQAVIHDPLGALR